MADPTGGWTRRRFLEWWARRGAAAVYETMTTLGMINARSRGLGRAAAAAQGRETDLGAGRLTAAYDLFRAGGYSVTILEAQNRPGGRSLTACRGTKIVEVSKEHGETHQECKFDEHLYLNMGMSVEHVLQQIAGLRPRTVPEILAAPETRRLVQGRF